MDNNDNYFQSVTMSEEELECGRNRLQILHKNICTQFQPFREYFLNLPIARIVHARPKFKPTLSLNLRDNLKIERQIKYLKSAVPHDYCQEAMQDLLADEEYESIKKQKNTSAIFKDKLYWAEETKIKSIRIADFITKTKLQPNKQIWNVTVASPVELIDLHEWIYQLTVYNSFLIVRTPRSLYVIDPGEGKVISRMDFDSEMVNFYPYQGKSQEKILISTSEGRISQLYEQSFNSETSKLLWCKIDGLINSLWTITPNQVLMCKENMIISADRRKKAINELHRRSNCHSNRIYSGISLDRTAFGPRYFAITESYSVNIYDMRKTYEPILKIDHYCEESPPSILQIYSSQSEHLQKELKLQDFDAFLSDSSQFREKNPLLIAHSPYYTGSSVFTELSIDWESPEERIQKDFLGETNQFSNKFQLLYDPGKIYENYHPLSITPLKLQNQIGFFHVDNYHGLSLQIFQRIPVNHNIKTYKRANNLNDIYQRVDFMKQDCIEELPEPNQEWFLNHLLQKQFEQKSGDYWADLMNEESLELEQNTFQSKVVRYADLKKFYHRIYEQSKDYQTSQKIKEEEAIIRKDLYLNKNLPKATQQTQSLTQKQDNAKHSLQIGHLSEQAFNQLLEPWNSQ